MSIFGKIFGKIFGTTPANAAEAAPGDQVASTGAAAQTVDVAAVLDALPGASNFNWRTSIVDLMKLVGLESSLTERKDLAKELGYTGDTGDSATMNIWLHKQVLAKLAANGGKLPDDLAKHA